MLLAFFLSGLLLLLVRLLISLILCCVVLWGGCDFPLNLDRRDALNCKDCDVDCVSDSRGEDGRDDVVGGGGAEGEGGGVGNPSRVVRRGDRLFDFESPEGVGGGEVAISASFLKRSMMGVSGAVKERRWV